MARIFERIALALERIAESLEVRQDSTVTTIKPEGLSKEDAARFLGVDVATVEYLIRARALEYVQYGSQRGRIVTVAGLRRFLKERRQATADELLQKRQRA